MCKQVYIIDQARKQAADNLALYIETLKQEFARGFDRCLRTAGSRKDASDMEATLIGNILAYPQSDELVIETRDEMMQALDKFCLAEGECKNANMVGGFYKGVFAWADWNGFSSVASVRRYMDRHPSAHLEDETGDVVSWTAFTAMAGTGGQES